MTDFQFWALTSSISALCVVLWWLGRRVMEKMDAIQSGMAELRQMMATELRGMDVRIARIEEHIWPRR